MVAMACGRLVSYLAEHSGLRSCMGILLFEGKDSMRMELGTMGIL